MANALVAQMLFLSADEPDKDITLFINSPGGSVTAGMAIYDTMQYIQSDVSTVCFGTAASMGAFLLGAGAKGGPDIARSEACATGSKQPRTNIAVAKCRSTHIQASVSPFRTPGS